MAYGRKKGSLGDQLKRYRMKIDGAEKYRKDEGLDDLWRRLIGLYRLRAFDGVDDERRAIVPIGFSTINVIYPSVSVNHPHIAVNARREEDGPRAIITEAVINYAWRHWKYQPEVRRAIKDSLIVGHGWVKTGYRYKEAEEPLTAEDADAELATLIGEADAYAEQNPELAAELPTDGEIQESLPESKVVVKEDRPFVERVSIFDVFVDPDATCPEDWRWIAQRIWRPLEDVKDDEDYSPSVRKSLQATKKQSSEAARRTDDDATKRDNTVDWVCIWEFYDVAKDTWSVFADSGDGFLRKPEKIPFATGQPFVMIRDYEVPDELFPIGELEGIETLQAELNGTRTDLFEHRHRWRTKYLYREEAFASSDAIDALNSEESNVMVPVSDGANLGSLADALIPMPQSSPPPEWYNQSELIENDIDRVSGINEYQRGGMPEIRRTATEASIAADASNARSADKLSMVEVTVAQIAEKVIGLLQQYMTGEQAARVVGPDGEPFWFTFDKEYIAGEFDFEVEAGSTQPMNETFRRQSALQLVDALAPMAEVVNKVELARHIMEAFGIKNADRFIAPPPALPLTPGQPALPGAEEAAPGAPIPPPPVDPNQAALPPELLNQLGGQTGLPADLVARLAQSTPIPA